MSIRDVSFSAPSSMEEAISTIKTRQAQLTTEKEAHRQTQMKLRQALHAVNPNLQQELSDLRQAYELAVETHTAETEAWALQQAAYDQTISELRADNEQLTEQVRTLEAQVAQLTAANATAAAESVRVTARVKVLESELEGLESLIAQIRARASETEQTMRAEFDARIATLKTQLSNEKVDRMREMVTHEQIVLNLRISHQKATDGFEAELERMRLREHKMTAAWKKQAAETEQAQQLIKDEFERELQETQQAVTDGRVRIAQLADQLAKSEDTAKQEAERRAVAEQTVEQVSGKLVEATADKETAERSMKVLQQELDAAMGRRTPWQNFEAYSAPKSPDSGISQITRN